MAIKTTNLIVTGKTTINGETPAEKKTADEQVLGLTNNSGTKLVVDGKVKKISKKSAYLLDMLTLDDE